VDLGDQVAAVAVGAAAVAAAAVAPRDVSVVAALVQEIIVNNPVLDLVVVMGPLDLVVTEVNKIATRILLILIEN